MSAAYQQALDYLYGFVNFEHRKMDQYTQEYINLERPERFLTTLGAPQDSYPSIHIAGTKGKGSVAMFCASALQHSGLRVGLYTSPHLQDFRDRIRVLRPADSDGRISQDQVVTLTERIKPIVAEMPGLTWYELVTALAFLHFAESKIDVAVVEVGLGGRLDATNVLNPLVSVITSLSIDHTMLLGHTLVEIAREKGGIIKPGVPVISAAQQEAALSELIAIAENRQAPMTLIGREWEYDRWQEPAPDGAGPYKWRKQVTITRAPKFLIQELPYRFELSLAGRHQQENAVLALAALTEVKKHLPAVDLDAVRKGLAQVDWPGRFHIVKPTESTAALLLDCAHNLDSAEKLALALKEDFTYGNLWLIVGITIDKDIDGILNALLPLTNHAVLTASSHLRAASPDELQKAAVGFGRRLTMKANVAESLEFVLSLAAPEDMVCITGSIFVVADLLNDWESLQSKLDQGELELAPPIKSSSPVHPKEK